MRGNLGGCLIGQVISNAGDTGRFGVDLYTVLHNGIQRAITSRVDGIIEEVSLKAENFVPHDPRCAELRKFLIDHGMALFQQRNFRAAFPILQRFVKH